MENIFSLQRFWLLVRKHANDNRTNFPFLLIAMILPVIFSYSMSKKLDVDTVSTNYFIFIVLVGGIYTGMFFKKWTYTARASTLLMLPASALEKIVLVLFYSVVIFIPVFSVVFYCSHLALFKILSPGMPFQFIEQYTEQSTLHTVILSALLPYIFFQSLVFLFSVCFKNRQTVIAFGLIVIFYFVINVWWNQYYMHWLTGNESIRVVNQFVFFPTDVRYFQEENARITSLLITNLSILIIAIGAPFFYTAAYFKLKEKEI